MRFCVNCNSNKEIEKVIGYFSNQRIINGVDRLVIESDKEIVFSSKNWYSIERHYKGLLDIGILNCCVSK